MKIASVSEIVEDVKTCLDEIGFNDSEFLSGSDNMEMDSIIESKTEDAIRFVYQTADVSLLELEWKDGKADVDDDDENMAVVTLGDEVLRVCYAKLSGWIRALTEPILYSDDEYASLKNVITTGYPDNPKMAINIEGGTKVLEMYGVKGSYPAYKLGYMKEPSVSNDGYGCYQIPDKVYRGVVYYTAGLTLLTFKDSHADSLMNQAIQMIGAK